MAAAPAPAAPEPDRRCPECGTLMRVLLFMGVQPDGHVCPRCGLYVSPDGEPLARVI